jgi:hypothetical protein
VLLWAGRENPPHLKPASLRQLCRAWFKVELPEHILATPAVGYLDYKGRSNGRPIGCYERLGPALVTLDVAYNAVDGFAEDFGRDLRGSAQRDQDQSDACKKSGRHFRYPFR